MRLIDADALRDQIMSTPPDRGLMHTAVIAKMIDDTPTIDPESLRPQWIPVEWHKTTPDDGIDAERYPICLNCYMPNEGDEILVTNGIHVWQDVCYFYDGYGLESGNDWIDMTAWMPLPEPYKPDDAKMEGI